MEQLVSVIIPNFNYGRFLQLTIDSALNQTYNNLEVIVVDNGSTDNSRSILESYGERIITIFQNNQGQAAARNSGLAIARGDLIALLDADDYWESSKIEQQLALINDQSELVYTGVRQFKSESGATVKTVLPRFKGDCSMAFLEYPSRSIVPVGESSVLLTRSLLERVGNFNTLLNSACGRDFFRRCSKHTEFSFVNESLINYRLHDSNMSTNSRLMMNDTVKAYGLLFADSEWKFALKYKRRCLSRLNWSFFKTSVKNQDALGTLKNLSSLCKVIFSRQIPR